MPRRTAHACRYPGCPVIIHDDAAYCLDHARLVQRQTDAQRGSAARRGYGHRWRKLRQMFLSENPVCADPFGVHAPGLALATDVDHIKPKKFGGDAWDWDNLQALCHECHSRKTATERRG